MEAFFTKVLTAALIAILADKKAQDAIKGFIKEAVDEATKDMANIIENIPTQIDSLEKSAINNLDEVDGKVGNLQEQLTSIPGQIISGVAKAVEDAIKSINPLGGLFGQQ